MWASPSTLDPAWVVANCDGIKECVSCTATDISNESSPRSCFRLLIEPGHRVFILKQTPTDEKGEPVAGRVQLSKALGLAREGLFYHFFGRDFSDAIIPRPIYSHGDMESGVKVVIMTDLSQDHYVDSGALFGNGNPNNWRRDLPSYELKAGRPHCSLVAEITFVALARLHARFWRQHRLLEPFEDEVTKKKVSFLRGADWVSGEGRQGYDGAQQYAKDRWEVGKTQISWEWDPNVREALETGLRGSTWERQRERLFAEGDWCLVQGDCWPGNVMWRGAEWRRKKAGDGEQHTEDGGQGDANDVDRVMLVDWEMVGVGSGPQELGQYVISNMRGEDRRQAEDRLVRRYYEQLRADVESIQKAPFKYTWEQCWQEYRLGGVERWLWFLCYFSGAPDEWSKKAGKFFHDQVSEFMKDHKITPNEIKQLRP